MCITSTTLISMKCGFNLYGMEISLAELMYQMVTD